VPINYAIYVAIYANIGYAIYASIGYAKKAVKLGKVMMKWVANKHTKQNP